MKTPSVALPFLARSLARGALLALALLGLALAAPPASPLEPGTSEIEIWPAAAPGSKDLALAEVVSERSRDPGLRDRFVTGITRPRLVAFAPSRPNGVALIIAPGGSYVREVLDKEGFETARWMAERGVSAFVLLYRLPGEGHAARADVPLQDAQRALRLVRTRSAQFGIDARRIGVLGFSAGGHVAASVATRFDARVYPAVDDIDRASARPDFAILMYPVISMDATIAHAGSRRALLGEAPNAAELAAHSPDQQVSSTTPPTLLILADDDKVVLPENGLLFYRALRRAGVPAELHIFSRGQHGFGIRGARGLPIGNWPELAWTWWSTFGITVTPTR